MSEVKERTNYYTGSPPKTRLDKPSLYEEQCARKRCEVAIRRVLIAYLSSGYAGMGVFDDGGPDINLEEAIDTLTEAQAKVREIVAKRRAPAKRVPR
jgi:hypothetical protein